MTTMIRTPQNYILTDIHNAAAIDHGFSQGLVLHNLLLKQTKLEKVQQIDAGLDG